MSLWSIIGLGNPGDEYASTRHNVGFDAIDLLSCHWKIPLDSKGSNFIFGSGNFKEHPVLLVKPMTYMNRSGQAFKRLQREPEVACERSLVILDDFNLPLGTVRIRLKGSHGGHNGLTSILEAADGQDVPRIRIGIGNVERDWEDFVLSPFTKKERTIADDAMDRTVVAVETILTEGFDKAMNLFNR